MGLAFNLSMAFFLVLLNGFFVASEFSIVKIRESKIASLKRQDSFRSLLLAKIHGQLDYYLSVCQLGITLASLGLGWIGEPAFNKLLHPIFLEFGIFSPSITHAISLTISFIIISYLHIVIGELVPKTLSIRKTVAVALWCAPLLYVCYIIMFPAIYILNINANFILSLFGSHAATHDTEHYTKEEIKHILSTHVEHKNMTHEATLIVEKAIEFSERSAADLMKPDEEMISLNLKAPLEVNMEIINEQQFSRYPVYENDKNNILGILHVKDFFAFQQQKLDMKKLKKSIHPILFVHFNQPAITIFNQFKKGVSHFAIVKNGNAVVGFITLDNILQALVGNISDEFNIIEPDYTKTKDHSLLMKGSTPIYILENVLEIEIPNTDAHTLSGLIMDKIGRFPKLKEKIDFDDFDIEVLKLQGAQIVLLKITPKSSNILSL